MRGQRSRPIPLGGWGSLDRRTKQGGVMLIEKTDKRIISCNLICDYNIACFQVLLVRLYSII